MTNNQRNVSYSPCFCLIVRKNTKKKVSKSTLLRIFAQLYKERMIKRTFFLVLCITFALLGTSAQSNPTIRPVAIFTTADGGSEQSDSYQGSAPLRARFEANAENVGSWQPHYEWRFSMESAREPYLVRYEQDTEYTFVKAGTHRVVLYAVFTQGTDTIAYTQEYWNDNTPITVSIATSKLEMPNAFSPNGDGINDIYKAKEGFQSITSFHAYIYNRWGQKLFEWTNPSQGWNGKYNGKDVKEGVYFVLVEATGADGRRFSIKKDVNLLRGYTETQSGGTP